MGLGLVCPEAHLLKLTASGAKATWLAAGSMIFKMKLVREAGKKGEQIVESLGITLNKREILVEINGRTARIIPDIWQKIADMRLIGDVKYVKKLCQSAQIRAILAKYDELAANGQKPLLIFFVMPQTKISAPLREAIESRGGFIGFIRERP